MRFTAVNSGKLRYSPKKQRGVVLVMVLMIVSVVVALAVNLGSDYLITQKRTSNQYLGLQVKLYLEGMDGLVKIVLDESDKANKNDNRHLEELWAQEFEPFPVDGGMVAATLEDLQARININSLVTAPPQGQAYSEPQLRFIRFLQTFDQLIQSPNEARDITDAIIDWVDPDTNPKGFNGAEDSYYTSLPKPYKASNRPMESVSELLLVKNMTPRLFQAIEPYIFAHSGLGSSSAINVNTAELPIMRTINSAGSDTPLTEADAQQLMSDRGPEGYLDMNGITGHPLYTGPGAILPDVAGLDVKTEWFLVTSFAEVGPRYATMKTILQRTSGSTVVIARTQTEF